MGDDRVHRQAELITSPANPTIKLARSLHRKRVRYRERALLVEGVRSIRTASDLGVQIRAFMIDASRQDELDPALVATLSALASRTLLIDAPLFKQITDTEHPQPLAAICAMPESVLPVDCSFVVALDGVRDPGNLGTLVRSSAAAGADGVALLPGSADPFNPKAVRASVGSIFALPVQSFSSIFEITSGSFISLPSVIIADSDGKRAYDDVDWTAPVLLIIGGEAEGAGQEARTYADELVSIPMAPGVESLNAAVAGSIIAFEVARQRRRRS
ncbi:MAG TPA: RNA methyltransferase [Thermomicrobiales bacterium]|nr:RNA methyltransferase [Thermomicrobiales bacterium]